MYYYWIINVGTGRKNGYSFSVKVYCDEKCPPCGGTRFEDRIVECAKERGLFDDELESYGCCVSEPYSEEDIYGGWDKNAIELSELNDEKPEEEEHEEEHEKSYYYLDDDTPIESLFD